MAFVLAPAVPAALAALGEAALWVGGALGLAYGTTAVVNQMSKAEDDANAKPATVAGQACATCEPPDCKKLRDGMRKDANEIEQRINDMKADDSNHQLFRNHYSLSEAHPDYGSWVGHQLQIKYKQKALKNKLDQSSKIGCAPPPSSITQWLRSSAPSTPAGW